MCDTLGARHVPDRLCGGTVAVSIQVFDLHLLPLSSLNELTQRDMDMIRAVFKGEEA